MKKRSEKKFNLSNRLSYTIVAVIALALISVGVYAYGTSSPSTFGHSIGEIAAPSGCGSGQVLSWTGSAWSCVTASSGISALDFKSVYASSSGIEGPVSWEGSSYYRYSATASCPSGYTVISGYCGGSPGFLVESGSAGNAYRCIYYTKLSSGSGHAYAICLKSTQMTLS